MMLTGFERVLRATGRPYELVEGWRRRDARTVPGLGYKDVRAVMVHTTEVDDALVRTGAEFPKMADTLDRGGTHTYPIVIGRTGKIAMVAAGTGHHAGRGRWDGRAPYPGLRIPEGEGNWYTLGIGVEAGKHENHPTREQLVSLIALLVAIDQDWGERLPVIMHGEYAPDRRDDPHGVAWADIRRARDLGSWAALEAEKQGQASMATPAARTWTVRPGDSLWRVQQATGVRVATLQRLNRLGSSTLIYPGQALRLT